MDVNHPIHGYDELFGHDLVDIAPFPLLPRLKGLDDRVLGAVVVLGGVLVLRRIAAADVAAVEAAAEMHPAVAGLQALLAALRRARGSVVGGPEMFTDFWHFLPSSKLRS